MSNTRESILSYRSSLKSPNIIVDKLDNINEVSTVINAAVGTLGCLYSKAIYMSVLCTHSLVRPCDVNMFLCEGCMVLGTLINMPSFTVYQTLFTPQYNMTIFNTRRWL